MATGLRSGGGFTAQQMVDIGNMITVAITNTAAAGGGGGGARAAVPNLAPPSYALPPEDLPNGDPHPDGKKFRDGTTNYLDAT